MWGSEKFIIFRSKNIKQRIFGRLRRVKWRPLSQENLNMPGSSHIYRNNFGKMLAGGATQWLRKHPWSSLLQETCKGGSP